MEVVGWQIQVSPIISKLTWRRGDYGNSFGKPVYSLQTCLSFWTQKQIFITSQTLTFNPMPKSFVNYSHFSPCPWNIGAFGAVFKVLTPLTVLKLRTSFTNFFSNDFFLLLILPFEGDQSCPTYLKMRRPKNFLVS